MVQTHTMFVLFFLQIGDLLGTSLLAMAFLALEEIGIVPPLPPTLPKHTYNNHIENLKFPR